MGVAIGDVNNDGLPDVLLTEYGRIRLFLNNGNGTFTDVTKQSGLDNPHWGTSAAFLDYDRDGWLDLVVVNYLDYDPTKVCDRGGWARDYCSPMSFPGTVTRLFRNRGLRGEGKKCVSFEDVTLASGLASRPGRGLGVVCADFNGDGWPDIFVANDAQANHLWINRHNGTFTEEAVPRGLAYDGMGYPLGNMGVALGDVDRDGRFDLFVTHLTEEHHTLWMQRRRGHFEDRTVWSNLNASHWRGTGFGTAFGDFDNDGNLDLAVVNGRVSRKSTTARWSTLESYWALFQERNQVFANTGDGRFRDISLNNAAFCGFNAVSRGLAMGSLRGDGSLDLLVTTIAGPARLFRNVAPKAGHWLLVHAIDPKLGGRDAYGAEITVRASGRSWKGLINPGQSYLCSNDPRAHFGLGRATRVESIEVQWPDGKKETFPGGPVDRKALLRKGDGK
jgi:hypothetical protein